MEQINRLLGLEKVSDLQIMRAIMVQNMNRCQGLIGHDLPEVSVDYEERIKFMSKFYQWIPVKPKILQKLVKNNEVSGALRTKANEFFGKRDLQEALKLYNLAILFAEVTGEELGLAFANRSALMMEQKDPKGGLKDIELALKNNYPERLMGKLEKRREKFVAMLEDFERSCVIKGIKSEMARRRKFRDEELLKLKNPSPTIPSAEDFVKIEYTEDGGRQLVVNKDVRVGTVVIVERPFTSVNQELLKFDAATHCDNCGIFVKNGLPCKRCVFVMYCNEECRSEAQFGHHQFECNCLSSLYVDSTDPYAHLAFRIVCKVGPEELYRLFTTRDPSYCDAKKPFGMEANCKYESDSYLPIHHLVSHSSGLEKQSRYDNGLKAMQLVSVLEARTNFFLSPKGKRNEFKNFVAAILLRSIETLPQNGIGIAEMQPLQGFTLADVYLREELKVTMKEAMRPGNNSFFGYPSVGIYGVGSLMNHSCDPSVIRVNDVSHGTMAVVTTRGMKKGDILTTSYGVEFQTTSLLERKSYLKRAYHFDCQCVACKQEWPTDAILVTKSGNPEFTCPPCSKAFSHEEKGSVEFLKCCLTNSRTTCCLCGRSYSRDTLRQGCMMAFVKCAQGYTDTFTNRPLEAVKAFIEIADYLQFNIRPPHKFVGGNRHTIRQALSLILHFAE